MTVIFGHDEPIATFRSALGNERLHHAWLFAGPEGLGKASVAHMLAAQMLVEAVDEEGASPSPDHPIMKLLAAQSHPDFKLVERLPKDEKLREKPRSDWEGAERARSINIEQIRRLTNSFATTPSLSQRRVVVIDAVDDLERGGANALLKALEEPAKGTIFILISHAPGRLLPTIRSRCRVLRFSRLSESAMTSFLVAHMPQLAGPEAQKLIASANGAPGKAVRNAGLDLAAIDDALSKIAKSGDPHNAARSALAKSFSGKAAQQRYEAFLGRVPSFIAEHARNRSGAALETAVMQWETARNLAQNAVQASLDPQTVVFAMASHVAALAPAGTAAKA